MEQGGRVDGRVTMLQRKLPQVAVRTKKKTGHPDLCSQIKYSRFQ